MKVTKKVSMSLLDFVQKETPWVKAAIAVNTFAPISPFGDSTGSVSSEALFRSLFYRKTGREGETFLLSTSQSRGDLASVMGVASYRLSPVLIAASLNEQRKFSEEIQLPKPKRISLPLGSILEARRSYRKFTGKEIPINDISTILHYANGISGKLHMNIPGLDSVTFGDMEAPLRMAPSGGALYPINIYLLVQKVKGIPEGVFLYNPPSHSLGVIKKEPIAHLIPSLFTITEEILDLRSAAVIFVLSLCYWKTCRKYSNRGVRYGLIEAGEISQNIHLSSRALGYGTCDVAAYVDIDIEELIGVDSCTEFAISTLVVGDIE